MDEMKCKGKRIDNGEFVYGDRIEKNGFAWIVVDFEIPKSIKCGGLQVLSTTYEVVPETVGQFTGFMDKNGTEDSGIYKNDTIIITDGCFEAIGVVKMNSRIGQWMWIATEVDVNCAIEKKEIEIPLWEVLDEHYCWKGSLVGNTYENY